MLDPDLELREGRPGHPDPYIRRGGLVSKTFFGPSGFSLVLKKGGPPPPPPPPAPPLDPPLMAKLYILKFFDQDKILSEMLHLNVYT